MKIYIIGPSCGGKTTLSNFLSIKLNITFLSIDKVLISVDPFSKKKIKILDESAIPILKDFLENESWILDGIQLFEPGLKSSNIIIYLKPSFFTCIYRQWKRYLLDSEQRKYGIRNNLKLSISIFKQFFEKKDYSKINDYRYSRIWKLDEIAKRYDKKVIVVHNTDKTNYEKIIKQLIL